MRHDPPRARVWLAAATFGTALLFAKRARLGEGAPGPALGFI
jgi:hypothetical protein